MRRLHLFEFEDLTWFPSAIREAMTDFLSFMGALADKPLAPFAARLERALKVTGDDRLLDLASGGGGPAITVARLLSRERATPVKVTLDGSLPEPPQARARSSRRARVRSTSWKRRSDATRVPEELAGFRLICNAFHHLPPGAARLCLLDAVEKRRGDRARRVRGSLSLRRAPDFARTWRDVARHALHLDLVVRVASCSRTWSHSSRSARGGTASFRVFAPMTKRSCAA